MTFVPAIRFAGAIFTSEGPAVASPFTVFRKNQKIMLAVVAILAMVAFVFLDPLMKYMGRSARQENPVVVKTTYGVLTQSELYSMVESRKLVEFFLKRLTAAAVNEQVKAGRLDPRDQFQSEGDLYGFWHQRLTERSKPGPEESAIETLVLSRRAGQAGMVVSDRAINDLLDQITSKSLSSRQISELVGGLQTGHKVSIGRIFDSIRVEMLASKFAELFAQSLRDIPPAQRFEYYLRLNRRAKAEVMPLAVADFTAQVADPSADELQKFYDEYKERFPDPTSPEPGFKQPKRAAFQYLKADYAKFQEEFKPQVTEDEIREYYEKNKAQFRVVEPEDKDQAKDAESDAKGEAKPEQPAAPEGDKPADPSAKPGADQPPAEKPSADKATEPEKPAEPPQPGDPKPGPSPQSQREARPSAIRLVSTAQAVEADKDAAGDKPAADSSDKDKGAADKPPGADPVAGDKPAADASGSDKDAADKDAADKDAADKAAADKEAAPKFEPLEKVHDMIRDNLASQKAQVRIGEIFEELTTAMRRYSDELERYEARKDTDRNATAPEPLPMAELAKAKGLEAKELPLVTATEAAREDLGGLSKVVPHPSIPNNSIRQPFAEFAFSDSLPLYRPVADTDNEGNVYLFWKTKEEAAYVPSLEQIKDQVAKAWKMIDARKLARKRAEEYATQARAADKPLKDVFAAQSSLKVAETGAFSWLSVGNVPFNPFAQPHLSAIDGVEDPGEAIMETVFSLPAGGVGVAMNHPQNTVYVIRLVEYERPLDELRQDFATELPMRYMSVATADQRKLYMTWLDDMNKEASVEWLRPADTAIARRIASNEPPPDDSDF